MPSNISNRQYQVYCPCASWGSTTSAAKIEGGVVSCFKCCCENTYLNDASACDSFELTASQVCKTACDASVIECQTCKETLLKDWYESNVPVSMRNCIECCQDWRNRNIHS